MSAAPRCVWLDGRVVPAQEAKVSVFDRGFLFGDGVYEGLRAFGGRVVGEQLHIDRLKAGLAAIGVEGFDAEALPAMTRELLAAEGLEDAFIYWQITRGAPPPGLAARTRKASELRTFAPTVVGFATPQPSLEHCCAPAVKTAAVVEDPRWRRCDIKAVSLLGAVLAGLEAAAQGAEDAILVRDSLVAEAQHANVVLAVDGAVVTPSLDSVPMLAGVTRRLLLDACPEIVEQPVTVEQLRRADEVMLVGTTTMVTAVTALDGSPVPGAAGGAPGPVCRRLYDTLVEAIERDIARPVQEAAS